VNLKEKWDKYEGTESEKQKTAKNRKNASTGA
jgi:hypothetical protein